MSQRRYELTDFEWSVIAPLLPNKPRGVPRVDDRRVLEWHLLAASESFAVGVHSGTLWSGDDMLQPLRALAQSRRVGPLVRGYIKGLRGRCADDRQLVDPRSPACRQRQKGGPQGTAAGHDFDGRCIGRSRGGLTTKIHALVDARGLPIVLKLTPGQARDGRSAADMLDTLGDGDVLLADRAYASDAL